MLELVYMEINVENYISSMNYLLLVYVGMCIEALIYGVQVIVLEKENKQIKAHFCKENVLNEIIGGIEIFEIDSRSNNVIGHMNVHKDLNHVQENEQHNKDLEVVNAVDVNEKDS